MLVQRIHINLGEIVLYKEKESILYIDRCMVCFVFFQLIYFTFFMELKRIGSPVWYTIQVATLTFTELAFVSLSFFVYIQLISIEEKRPTANIHCHCFEIVIYIYLTHKKI